MRQLAIILFTLLSFTISKAQDGKPTKEETLQYIKGVLDGKEFNNLYEDRRAGRNISVTQTKEDVHKVSNMEMKSCILEFDDEYNHYFQAVGFDSNGKVNYPRTLDKDRNWSRRGSIDFSRTELIQFGIWELYDKENYEKDLSTGRKVIRLVFHQKKSDGTYENPVDIYIGIYDINFQDYESLKIYKAFQHLRKLCNAPEPISFD